MINLATFEPVDYLVIGHVTQDLGSGGVRLGGTAAFSAMTARALGLRVGIITSCSPQTNLDVLSGIQVISLPSERSTTFENIYTETGRRQVLHSQANLIPVDSVPEKWRRAAIIHLGPVAQELEPAFTELLPSGFLGLTPQGWMRTWDQSGVVTGKTWEANEQVLQKIGAMVISIEDVMGNEEQIESLAQHTRVLAVTEGASGARIYWHGDQRRFHAPAMKEVDATGAGDIFAAAFFIRLLATRDPWEAGRFAVKLSARSVTRFGLEGIPTAAEINEYLVEVI